MRFLCVDDEQLSLRKLERILKKLCPDAEIVCEDNYKTALEHAGEKFTAAFLDIEMPEMNGVELASLLREENDRLNVIFVTAYDTYALQAYQVYASGYLTKPYDSDAIARQLANLRYSAEEAATDEAQMQAEVSPPEQERKKARARCFGYFEIFVGNEPMVFERRASKEILAYLIHIRGAAANRLEISSILWEDADEIERKKGYFRSLIASLRSTLKNYGMEDLLISHRDSFAINTSLLDCDYLRYMDGDTDPQVQFRGEYLNQYSWGEDTIARLSDWN